MSTYIINNEPETTTPADADETVVYSAAAKRTRKVGLDTLRAYMHSGLANATAATLTVTREAHAGRTVTLNRAAGIAVTLPAATGSGDSYRFVVGTTFTGAGTIKVVGNDTMIGTATLYQDGGDTVVGFAAGGTDDTLTFTATNTTGGIAGACVDLQDIGADLWHVNYVSDAANTEATPFSATVAP
jgi:hypothetical protein